MNIRSIALATVGFIGGALTGAIGTAYVLLTPPSNFVGAVKDEGKINERERGR